MQLHYKKTTFIFGAFIINKEKIFAIMVAVMAFPHQSPHQLTLINQDLHTTHTNFSNSWEKSEKVNFRWREVITKY